MKVGACTEVGGSERSSTGAGVAVEEVAFSAFSAFSLSCLNLLKYRGEANSVIWSGSMMFCVWPLCHSVAGVERGVVVDTAYQGRE